LKLLNRYLAFSAINYVRIFKFSLVVLFLTHGHASGQLGGNLMAEWQKMHQNKQGALEEFNDAKFGLFIHWGLYSELAGEWQGQKIPGLSE
jgi:hypothetical protein